MIIEWLSHLSSAAIYVAFAGIIFAESGLLFGVVLPGDSLLFTLGIFAATGKLSIVALLIIGIIAALLGDQAGYRFGHLVGEKVFENKKNQRFLKKEHVEKTQAFYDKYGPMTLVLARFMPFARTIAPIMAGVGKMPHATFTKFNILGGVGWVLSVTLMGYFLGNTIDNPERYILPIVSGIIVVSILPAIIGYAKSLMHKKKSS